MISFLDIRFPEDISYGLAGGPTFKTMTVIRPSGHEDRDQRNEMAIHKYDAAHGLKDQTDLDNLITFFLIVAGMAIGFRFKDWMDYKCLVANGIMNQVPIGTGTPTYQAYKKYVNAGGIHYRILQKLVTGTFTGYRNGGALTIGSGAGNISFDVNTGLITFVADAESNASSITPGATTQVVLAANLGFVAGNLLYLTGFTGADANLVNGLAHTINSITGVGPYTFTLATNTAGKTITLGSGKGQKYPQPFVIGTTATASALTLGVTTQVTLSANLGLSAGQFVYLEGFTGDDAILLNGKIHKIVSITGVGPYVFTIEAYTYGQSITVGSGLARKIEDLLTLATEFDVPCRFDTDEMRSTITNYNVNDWGQIPIIEIKDIV